MVLNEALQALVRLREKAIAEKGVTEDQLHRLEGIRRLLLRAKAVCAVSFPWPVEIPPWSVLQAVQTER